MVQREYPLDYVPPSLGDDIAEDAPRRKLLHKIFIAVVVVMVLVLIIGRVL